MKRLISILMTLVIIGLGMADAQGVMGRIRKAVTVTEQPQQNNQRSSSSSGKPSWKQRIDNEFTSPGQDVNGDGSMYMMVTYDGEDDVIILLYMNTADGVSVMKQVFETNDSEMLEMFQELADEARDEYGIPDSSTVYIGVWDYKKNEILGARSYEANRSGSSSNRNSSSGSSRSNNNWMSQLYRDFPKNSYDTQPYSKYPGVIRRLWIDDDNPDMMTVHINLTFSDSQLGRDVIKTLKNKTSQIGDIDNLMLEIRQEYGIPSNVDLFLAARHDGEAEYRGDYQSDYHADLSRSYGLFKKNNSSSSSSNRRRGNWKSNLLADFPEEGYGNYLSFPGYPNVQRWLWINDDGDTVHFDIKIRNSSIRSRVHSVLRDKGYKIQDVDNMIYKVRQEYDIPSNIDIFLYLEDVDGGNNYRGDYQQDYNVNLSKNYGLFD